MNENLAVIEDVTVVPTARFTETFRACKPGYTQGYVTNDGLRLSEGNSCYTRTPRSDDIIYKDREKVIRKLNIPHIETDPSGIEQLDGERVPIYEIYYFESGHCITAPNVDVGLELERYLKNN